MATLNQVNLIGNVGKDPEVKAIGENQRVAELTLATSRKYKLQDGTLKEETEWHNIVLFGNLVDVAAKYVRKGGSIYVGGRLRTRDWTDQQGNKHYKTEIVADAMQLLGGRSDAQSQGQSQGAQPQGGGYRQAAAAPAQQLAFGGQQEDDNFPFK